MNKSIEEQVEHIAYKAIYDKYEGLDADGDDVSSTDQQEQLEKDIHALIQQALDANNKEWVERLRALPSYNESGYGEIVVNRDDIDALITTHSKENQ
jgi:hypothetical protein